MFDFFKGNNKKHLDNSTNVNKLVDPDLMVNIRKIYKPVNRINNDDHKKLTELMELIKELNIDITYDELTTIIYLYEEFM